MALFSFTVSAVVTSSLAWFKVADTLIASNIAIDFLKDEDFEVGLKKDNETTFFKASDSSTTPTIDNTTLKKYCSNFDPNGLLDLSSMYESSWLNSSTVFENTKPQLQIGYATGSNPNKTTAALAGYMQFEFYFKSDRNMYLFLDESTALTANEAANQKVADLYGYKVENLNKVKDCLRVSFYTESTFLIYEPNVDVSSNTAFAGRLNTKAPTSSYYDVDSKNNEILFGEYNYPGSELSTTYGDATLVYDEASRAAVPSAENLTGFVSGTAPSANGGLDIAKSESEGNLHIAHEKTYTLSELAKADEKAHPLVYIPAYSETDPTTVKRVVVTVYVEGWDLDVVNSVESGVFDLNLAFKGYYKSK